MKKLLCLAAVLLLFTGCSIQTDNEETNEVLQSFTADITITRGSSELCARLEKTSDSVFVTYTSPEEINGLAFTKNADGVKAEFSGLSVPFSEGLLPEKSVLSIIDRVFSAAEQKAYTVKKQNGFYVFTGSDEAFPFELFVSCETLFISSLSVPNYDVTIEFQNFTDGAA